MSVCPLEQKAYDLSKLNPSQSPLSLQTPEGLAPIGAALVADAVARSIPGLGALVALITGE